MALSKKYRLTSKLDFDKVFKEGKAVKGSFLFIRWRANESGFPRFGFVIPKKVYSRAVDRNRLKRVLSEIGVSYVKNNMTSSRDFVIMISKQGEEDLIKKELENTLR